MRIKEVQSGAVLVSLDPGECLLLAAACAIASEDQASRPQHPDGALYDAAEATLEALALLGAAGCYATKSAEFLSGWTLPIVRREWGIVATHQAVVR